MTIPFFDDVKYITHLENETNDVDNSNYITSCEELRLILNNICNSLQHPVTVININYGSEHFEFARVDSDASYYAIRPTCRNFRIAAGESYCMKCDDYYARYCKALIENRECSIEPLDYFADICKNNPPELAHKNERAYLVYDCPMLGYCEMCFPIYFQNKIIGFLFVGEILLEKKKERKEEIVKEFFEKQDNIVYSDNIFKNYSESWYNENENYSFTDYMKRDTINSENILKDFSDNKSLKRTDHKHLLNDSEFQDLVSDCCKAVKSLESQLEEKWNEKKRHYFEQIIEDIKETFNNKYSEIRNKEIITYDEIQETFKTIWDSIIELKEVFSFDYCRIYENLPYIDGKSVAEEMDNIGYCPYNNKHLACDFSKISLSMSQCRNSLEESDENNPLLCFSYGDQKRLNEADNVVLACENLVVLFGISSVYVSDKNTDPKHLKILFREISKLFLHVCADLDRISALFIQQQHEKTLHMYRHECAHLAQRIQQNNKYYSNRERYENLKPDKKENVFRDINSTAVLLQHLSNNIGLLLGTDMSNNISKDDPKVDVRDEINKWTAMFRLELRKKNLWLLNTTVPLYGGIVFYMHNELFEIMLYNLIDNAVKYSYWGTNICVEVRPDSVIVKDFGIRIENGNRPYDLYYRNKQNVQDYLGDGIGLYSSKRIAEILHLNLHHTCRRISDYNIPLVEEALSRKLSFENNDIDWDEAVRQLRGIKYQDKKELLTLDSHNSDKTYSHVPDDVIYRDIIKPTYCVTFMIEGLEKYTEKGDEK